MGEEGGKSVSRATLGPHVAPAGPRQTLLRKPEAGSGLHGAARAPQAGGTFRRPLPRAAERGPRRLGAGHLPLPAGAQPNPRRAPGKRAPAQEFKARALDSARLPSGQTPWKLLWLRIRLTFYKRSKKERDKAGFPRPLLLASPQRRRRESVSRLLKSDSRPRAQSRPPCLECHVWGPPSKRSRLLQRRPRPDCETAPLESVCPSPFSHSNVLADLTSAPPNPHRAMSFHREPPTPPPGPGHGSCRLMGGHCVPTRCPLLACGALPVSVCARPSPSCPSPLRRHRNARRVAAWVTGRGPRRRRTSGPAPASPGTRSRHLKGFSGGATWP